MLEELIKNFTHAYGRTPQAIGQAPGRIEFIGNHTDYNGGFTMGVAIDKVVMCALAKRDDKKLCFCNARTGEKVYVEMNDITPRPRNLNWVNYPLGMFKFLIEAGLKADCGFDMYDMSSLPSGAGLSSSAAIELSSGMAFCSLYGFETDTLTIVRAGRKSENHFVGMPCGILDQGVSGFGKKDSIVFIDCLSEEFSTYPLPHTCKFWLFNSTKKHALVDGMYAERHQECMRAAKVLSEGGTPRLLREFSIQDLEAKRKLLDEKAYMRAEHIINENARVLKVRELLQKGDIKGVGEQMLLSHKSSKELFENSCEELDWLVDAVSKLDGVYGARLSGGGFGGAIVALTDESFSEAHAQKIAESYSKVFGRAPMVFTCSAGDGAKKVSI